MRPLIFSYAVSVFISDKLWNATLILATGSLNTVKLKKSELFNQVLFSWVLELFVYLLINTCVLSLWPLCDGLYPDQVFLHPCGDPRVVGPGTATPLLTKPGKTAYWRQVCSSADKASWQQGSMKGWNGIQEEEKRGKDQGWPGWGKWNRKSIIFVKSPSQENDYISILIILKS